MISAPLTDEVERMAGRTQRWIVRIVEGLDEKTDPENLRADPRSLRSSACAERPDPDGA